MIYVFILSFVEQRKITISGKLCRYYAYVVHPTNAKITREDLPEIPMDKV